MSITNDVNYPEALQKGLFFQRFGHLDCKENCQIEHPFTGKDLSKLFEQKCPRCQKQVTSWTNSKYDNVPRSSLTPLSDVLNKTLSEDCKTSFVEETVTNIFQKNFSKTKNNPNLEKVQKIFKTHFTGKVFSNLTSTYRTIPLQLAKVDLKCVAPSTSDKPKIIQTPLVVKKPIEETIQRICEIGLSDIQKLLKLPEFFRKKIEDPSDLENYLTNSFTGFTSCLYSHLLKEAQSLSVKDFEKTYSEALKKLSPDLRSTLFGDISRDWLKNPTAANRHLFLSMMKYCFDWNFTLTNLTKSQITHTQSFLENAIKNNHPINNLEAFLHTFFLEPIYTRQFVSETFIKKFLTNHIAKIAKLSTSLKTKYGFLGKHFSSFDNETKETLLKALKSAKDVNAYNIATAIEKIEKAKTFNECIPHFQTLVDLEVFTNEEIRKLSTFSFPFPKFSSFKGDSTYPTIPEENPTLESKDHFIAKYSRHVQENKRNPKVEKFLFGYHKETQKMVWGSYIDTVDLNKQHFIELEYCPGSILVFYQSDTTEAFDPCLEIIKVIDPSTGSLKKVLKLPPNTKKRDVHITSSIEGAYIVKNNKVLFGHFEEEKSASSPYFKEKSPNTFTWKQTSERPCIKGKKIPLGDFMGIQRLGSFTIEVHAPKHTCALGNIYSTLEKDGFLFSIEKEEGRWSAVKRKFLNNESVLSKPIQSTSTDPRSEVVEEKGEIRIKKENRESISFEEKTESKNRQKTISNKN